MVTLSEHTKVMIEYAQFRGPGLWELATTAVALEAQLTKKSFHTLMLLGYDPTKVDRAEVLYPYSSGMLSHPVLLASAMQEYDLALASAILERARADADPAAPGYGADKSQPIGGYGTAAYQTYTPDPPCEELLNQRLPAAPWYLPQHTAWYSPEGATKAAEEATVRGDLYYFLEKLHQAVGHTEEGQRLCRKLATAKLCQRVRERAKPNTYSDLTRAVRFAHLPRLREALADKGGVLTMLLGFHPDANEQEMARTLAYLGSTWEQGVAFLPRGPTIPELNRLGGATVLTVLSRMPWGYLKPLLDKDPAGVRTQLLEFDDLAKARAALQEENKVRMKRSESFTFDSAVWQAYKARLIDSYDAGVEYRKAVELLDVPRDAAAYLLHAQWSGLEEHRHAFEWLERYPELAPKLKAFKAPYTLGTDHNAKYYPEMPKG